MARNDPLGRLLLAIAGSGANREELRKFANWLAGQRPDSFVETIDALRQLASTATFGSVSQTQPSPSTNLSELTSRIEYLLLDGAGLSKKQAMDEMALELTRRTSWVGSSNSRTSFSDFIRRAVDQTSESQLLHIATLVRNRHAHPTIETDWPLKADEK